MQHHFSPAAGLPTEYAAFTAPFRSNIRACLSLACTLLLSSAAWNRPAAAQDAVHPGDPIKYNEHMDVMNLVKASDATQTTVGSGSWSDAGIWSKKRVPGPEDRVIIAAGHTVTIDRVEGVPVRTVGVKGTLRFLPTADTELAVDTLVIEPSGRLEIGTEAHPIAAEKTARLKFVMAHPIQETDPRWDPERISGGLISHGAATLFGAQKTAFVRSEGGRSGITALKLKQAPSHWKVGDTLLIPGVNPHQPEDELREIRSLSADGLTVTLSSALQYSHQPPRKDLFVDIGDISRNVIVETDPANAADIHRRGHVMFMHNPNVALGYVRFENVGRSDKGIPSDDHIPGAKGVIVNPNPPLNPRGRYAVHFHRTGADRSGPPVMVTGCVALHSPGWGFVNHGGFVVFTDNIAYDVKGAAFVTERGDEAGAFVHNLSVRNDGLFKLNGLFHFDGVDDPLIFADHDTKITGPRKLITDFGYGGNGFWMQGGAAYLKDNSAYGFTDGAYVAYGRGIDLALEQEGGQGEINFIPTRNLCYGDLKNTGQTELAEISLRWFDNTAVGGGVAVHVLQNHPNDPKLPRSQWSQIFGFIGWNIFSPNRPNNNFFDLRYSGNFVVSDLIALAGEYGKEAYLDAGDTGGPAYILFQKFDIEGFDVVRFQKGPWYLLDGYMDNKNVSASTASRYGVLQDVTFGNRYGKQKENDFTFIKEWDLLENMTVLWNRTTNGAPVQKQLYMAEQGGDVVFHSGGYPAQYQGLTNRQLLAQFGKVVGGSLIPENAQPVTDFRFLNLLAGPPTNPAPFLTLEPRQEVAWPIWAQKAEASPAPAGKSGAK